MALLLINRASKCASMNFRNPYSRLRLQKLKSGTVRISFYFGDRRFRYTNARILGQSIYPNSYQSEEREHKALELLMAFKTALDSGWSPVVQTDQINLLEALCRVSIDPNHTRKYQKDLKATLERFRDYVKANNLEAIESLKAVHCSRYLENYGCTPSTFNHERKRLSSILSTIYESEGLFNPVKAA